MNRRTRAFLQRKPTPLSFRLFAQLAEDDILFQPLIAALESDFYAVARPLLGDGGDEGCQVGNGRTIDPGDHVVDFDAGPLSGGALADHDQPATTRVADSRDA